MNHKMRWKWLRVEVYMMFAMFIAGVYGLLVGMKDRVPWWASLPVCFVAAGFHVAALSRAKALAAERT